MKSNNKIVVDLRKVTHAQLQWVTHSLGRTYKRHVKPLQPTVNGSEFDCDEIRGIITLGDAIKRFNNKQETMFEYATRRNLLDVWNPELELQLSNNHSLIYTGEVAISLWKAWKVRVF